MLVNLHTHTLFSDGTAPPEAYIEEAIKQRFTILGFSDHSPVPFDNEFTIPEEQLGQYYQAIKSYSLGLDLSDFKAMKDPNSLLTILTGLEYDYIPFRTNSLPEIRHQYDFDYVIGAVHLVTDDSSDHVWFIDGPDKSSYDNGLQLVFHGNIRRAVTAYYRQIQDMVLTQKPEIIGHLDKIKMHNRNRYFLESESWYVSLVDETLNLIKDAGCIVEVNTLGLYKGRSDSFFPGPEILLKIRNLKIPVIISSDAHDPAEIALLFPEARKILFDLGLQNQRVLTSHGWEDVPLF